MVFTFGDCELDEERWELQRAGAAVAVQPKELALLFYLVRHRDRVVNREELLEALWPGVFVGDGTLTRAVSLARLAIGGRDRDGDGIQTIARRGYRFSAAVRVIETPVPPATQPEPPALQSPVDSSNPFVGREHTVARLREAWAQAAASSTRVVLLSGPAGIGKTRTAHELARFVRQHGGHVVTTRGLPGAADAPYALWVQAAAERQHAHATTDPVSNPPFPEPSSRDWSNPGLAAPTEPDVAPEVTTRRTLDAIAQWVRVAAAGAPLLLVLDDLHRADAPSLEALTFVASAVADARLLMLAAFRDDEIEAAPTLQSVCATLTATGRCESVQLQGLNQADTGRLAGVLAGSALSAGMAATLWGRTEGNPLFVHEIVRLLVDEGSALQPDASTLPALVPALVRDVIGSRVARLSDACRDCLAAAATIGVHFSVELLQRTTGIPTDQLLERIEEAERHRVLDPDSTIEPGYRFAHPLIHEVVLQNIGRGERVRLRGSPPR